MARIDSGTPGPNDTEREVYRQVMTGLKRTIANDANISRPVYDLDAIQRHLGQLGRQQFTSKDKGVRLDLEAKVHFAPNLARTDVTAIILSIKRQSTALAIFNVLKKLLERKAKPKKEDSFLRLTPNGYQIVHDEAALGRRPALSQYTPQAANPIGEITTEFLTHLRRTLDAEKRRS